MPPRIVLCTAGSLGDLHPFIALGLALKARGVQAEIATSPEYGPKILAAGLGFHSVGPGLAELERRFGLDKAALTEQVAKSNAFLFEKMLLPNLEDGARAVISVADGCVAIVVGSAVLFARRSREGAAPGVVPAPGGSRRPWCSRPMTRPFCPGRRG